jgi:mannose-6-phosphate isomerase-like protein (cupin superfamily)
MHILKKPFIPTFEKVGIVGTIFPSRTLTNKAEFVYIETETGHETSIIEHESDFIYYVIEGSGWFEIDGTKEGCSKGDLVVIPTGCRFTYQGRLTLLLIDTPPWREDQEETI